MISFDSSSNIIFCTISHLFSLYLGSTLYPKASNTLLVNIAVFKLDATTLGAKNSPCKILLLAPKLGPTSLPSPGREADGPPRHPKLSLKAC